jgi:hypothetical protein
MTVQVELEDEVLKKLDAGRAIQSDFSCADILKHISKSVTMRLHQSGTRLDLKNSSNDRHIHHLKQENSFCSLHEYSVR